MLVLLLAACKPGGEKKADTPDDKPVITVSIEPLRYFTEAIAGDRFDVVSMVPKGSSPETYDPTPAQLMSLSQSTAYLRIGFIGFEQTWMDRLTDNAPHLQIFDTSHGIDLIFPDGLPEEEPHAAEDGHAHHGPEPHIWNSPANARIIATNVFKALCTLDTKHRDDYLARYDSLCTVIDRTDSLCRQMLAQPGADHAFMIYHPALSYLARDYGLLQLSIEDGALHRGRRQGTLTRPPERAHQCLPRREYPRHLRATRVRPPQRRAHRPADRHPRGGHQPPGLRLGSRDTENG